MATRLLHVSGRGALCGRGDAGGAEGPDEHEGDRAQGAGGARARDRDGQQGVASAPLHAAIVRAHL